MIEIDFDALAAPFPVERISWRVGSTTQDKSRGMALAYIDARDVMERLDSACTPAGWQATYPHANGKTVCDLSLKIDGEWVTKANGAGDTDVEGEKGACSDAFKRAAVLWGVGRYLYDVDSPWVELEAKGRSHAIKDTEFAKLNAALERAHTVVEWGTPAERAAVRALSNAVRTTLHTKDHIRLWRKENEGNLSVLRVKAREHLNHLLDLAWDAAEAKEAA